MKSIVKQAFKFFGISGIGFLVDISIFTIFSTILNYNEVIVNIISSLIAVTLVYTFSTKKIFINNNISLRKKYFIYVIYQIVIILLSSTIIGYLNRFLLTLSITKYSKILAKILVTPFTMITNFIFMKFLIEKM